MPLASIQDLDQVLSPQAREALKYLEIFARRTVDGMLHGMHSSRRKGVSTDFDHHKIYQPGDSLKHVDWKVSARSDEIFVKRYIEDTALSVRIVVDGSGSMARRSGEHPAKALHAARLAACLAYLILNQKDAVGLNLAGHDGAWLPTRSSEQQLVRILRLLAAADPARDDCLATSLRQVTERGERRGLVVVVSDLMMDPEPVQKALGQLAARGHEVLLCHLRDPAEEDFPYNRWVTFNSLEGAGRQRVDAVPLKKVYLEEYRALVDSYREWARKNDAHVISWRTDEAVGPVLAAYVAYRSGVTGTR